MMAAAHLDNFLFLLFIAVAIFFQLLTRAATKAGRRSGGDNRNRRSSSTPQTPRSAGEQPVETDEDRIRKFLEALGQPTTSKPPPPVVQRPTYQKPVILPRSGRSILAPGLPPLTTRPPALPTETPASPQPAAVGPRKVVRPKADLPAFEVHEGPPPLTPITGAEVGQSTQAATSQTMLQQAGSKINLGTLLRTPFGLRDAIILREIFGPPRSMQPLDLVGNG